MDKVDILGVKLSRVKYDQAKDWLLRNLDTKESKQIVTVNPEFIVEAQQNEQFKQVLNQANLSVADGIGVRASAKLLSVNFPNNKAIRAILSFLYGLFVIGPSVIFNPKFFNTLPETITGVELTKSICRVASDNHKRIFFLGAKPGIADKAADNLKKQYPHFEVAGCYAGSPSQEEEEEIIQMINIAQPDYLLVAYGAPKQDLWISRNLNKFKKPLIGIGIGGTFDFCAGEVKRAPKSFRKRNLEWFYRLTKEPSKRAKRIFQATIIFPWLVWKEVICK